MLTFNLKKEWFKKIKSGEKTHEYREVKPYWITRMQNYFDLQDIEIEEMLKGQTCKRTFPIGFRCGYNGEILYFLTDSISIKNGLRTDLKIDKLVFDIEFS